MTEQRNPENYEERFSRIERHQEEVRRALWGYPDMGQDGFTKRIEKKLDKIDTDMEKLREDYDTLATTNTIKEAEKRGQDRVIRATGVTSFLTLLMLVATVIAIWQGLTPGV